MYAFPPVACRPFREVQVRRKVRAGTRSIMKKRFRSTCHPVAPGAAAGVELRDVFCDGHHFQLDVFSLPIVMPYRIGEQFRNRHFLYTLWGPASPNGPHPLDPHRVRMEVVGPGAPVAAEVDDGHPTVEGARDRVAGPAGSAVVIADEHRAMVEHRYVPVEAATSGVAFAQAVHIVGLR